MDRPPEGRLLSVKPLIEQAERDRQARRSTPRRSPLNPDGPVQIRHLRRSSQRSKTPSSRRSVTPLASTPLINGRTKPPAAPGDDSLMKCPSPVCPSVGLVETAELDGQICCTQCGAVIRESIIINDITFGENSSGAATIQGNYVGESQRYANNMGAAARRFGADRENKFEAADRRGKDEIKRLALALNITHAEQKAMQFYSLCRTVCFIQGREARTVAAVCLYIGCRSLGKSKTLLIDFAEKIHVNVFHLGQIYKDILAENFVSEKSLMFQDTIDIDGLLEKYAKRLEFGDSRVTQKVAHDASKILARMERDWIVTGRQPNGLAGACILIAARMNNFRRSIREVVYVVKSCDATIQKRLDEFNRTYASKLSVEDFRNYHDKIKHSAIEPPSVYQARERKEKRKRALEDVDGEEDDGAAQVTTDTTESTTTQEDLRRRAELPTPSPSTIGSHPVDEREGSTGSGEWLAITAAKAAKSANRRLKTNQPGFRRDAEGFAIPALPTPSIDTRSQRSHSRDEREESIISNVSTALSADDLEFLTSKVNPKKRQRRKKKVAEPPVPVTAEDLTVEEELSEQIALALIDIDGMDPEEKKAIEEAAKATADVEVAKGKGAQGLLPTNIDDKAIDDTEFDDDPEVKNCLLTKEETEAKEMIWVNMNSDWMRQQLKKRLEKDMEKAKRGSAKKAKKKRTLRRVGDMSGQSPSTPGEEEDGNIRMMNARAPNKSWSKFVNYEQLKALWNPYESGILQRTGSNTPSSPEAAAETGQVAAKATTTAEVGEEQVVDDADINYDDVSVGDDEDFDVALEEDYEAYAEGEFDDQWGGEEI